MSARSRTLAPPGRQVSAITGAGNRRRFGRTWWGAAWIQALEQRARLDPNRLPRGRSYARSGAVGELHVDVGEVWAEVMGSRGRPYHVLIRIRTFNDDEWRRLLDVVAAQVGHAAALLDGVLPPELVTDAAAANVDLLPGPGELGPRCSCPDWADPCKHAAAVCYLIADVLDTDPFALLLMRGRSRTQVLAELRHRRGGDGSAVVPGPLPDPGISASEVFRRTQQPGLPRPPLPPPRPARPAPFPGDFPTGVDGAGLLALAADAAARAHALLLREQSSTAELVSGGADEDLARRAVVLIGRPAFTLLARRAGLPARELTRWAVAWREGGPAGFDVLRREWDPDPDSVAEGRTAMGPDAAVRRNRISGHGLQLRLGRDGLWYRFSKVGRSWELDGAPAADPRSLLKPT
ncbi:MAG TPA: SWIM zinc finger family protein [Mycobacteriales bacterium]|nr:SWIM zinc finger family protein [Mycobacteriales bacterium]